jgi:hypothetical protein
MEPGPPATISVRNDTGVALIHSSRPLHETIADTNRTREEVR